MQERDDPAEQAPAAQEAKSEGQEEGQQQQQQGQNKELVADVAANAFRFKAIINSIMKYAISNLHLLIIDDKGQIIWPEAAALLDDTLKDYDINSLTDEQLQGVIILVIDRLITSRSFDDLDTVIERLPLTLRMGILSPAIAITKTYLSMHPEFKEDFLNPEKWDAIYTDYVKNNPDIAYLKDVLLTSKNLEEWLRQYVVHKLKIQP